MNVSKIEKHQILFSFASLILAALMDLAWFYSYTLVTQSMISIIISFLYWIFLMPFLLIVIYFSLIPLFLSIGYKCSIGKGLCEGDIYLTITPIISIFFAKYVTNTYQNPNLIYTSIVIFPLIYFFYSRLKLFSRFIQ